MASVPVRTWPTMLTRLSFMLRIARINWPVSSALRTSMVCVRSPAATLSATRTASLSGPEIARISRNPIRPASSTPTRITMDAMFRTMT